MAWHGMSAALYTYHAEADRGGTTLVDILYSQDHQTRSVIHSIGRQRALRTLHNIVTDEVLDHLQYVDVLQPSNICLCNAIVVTRKQHSQFAQTLHGS